MGMFEAVDDVVDADVDEVVEVVVLVSAGRQSCSRV